MKRSWYRLRYAYWLRVYFQDMTWREALRYPCPEQGDDPRQDAIDEASYA